MNEFMAENRAVQLYIARTAKLTPPQKEKIACQKLDKWLFRVRTAAPAERRRVTLQSLLSLWPFFSLAPIKVAQGFLQRHKDKA